MNLAMGNSYDVSMVMTIFTSDFSLNFSAALQLSASITQQSAPPLLPSNMPDPPHHTSD